MSTTDTELPSVADFAAEAEAWLKENGTPVPADRDDKMPQPGDELSLAVFHNLDHDQEQAVLDELAEWQRKKAERGYHAITWPEEFGGLGFSANSGSSCRRTNRWSSRSRSKTSTSCPSRWTSSPLPSCG